MTRTIVLWGLSAVFAGAVHAADKPLIAPTPAWVRPVAVPPLPATTDGTPVRVLLSDQQVRLERGHASNYSDVALLIQTPQGLTAGNIAFAWRPDTDVLTVHKLLIHRGAQMIDVLASGQTFTVLRREQNLENATLDGVLTATIQPEGLQVGDVLEFAGTIVSSDRVLKGHVEQIGGAWNGFAVERAHLAVQWPDTLPVHVRESAALPVARTTTAKGMSGFELAADHLQPIVPPKGAPPRYALGRMVEFTDYSAWADLGALMAPLYDKAATIPETSLLHAELGKIAALSPDPKTRTEAALALVQDRVRYVALAMGAGGYTPADAAETWSRRYGDCKGKTALLLALLRGLGIEAQPVAVSTVFGDGMDARLPMVGLFNHVLVRATVAGRPYWLDGTRSGDTRLDRLRVPNFGWGLPLVPTGAALVRMVPAPLERPGEQTSIRIDASAGIAAPAPTTIETVVRGDDALTTNLTLNALVGDARERALKDYWTNQYDFIEVKTATAAFDAKAGELRLAMTGTAKLDWANGNYQTDGTDVGYRADFAREPGPDHDAPFAVPFPYYTKVTEVILLPKGNGEFKLGTGMEVDQTAGGIEYRRHATIAANVFTIEKSERSVVPEFPGKDAAAQQAALRTLSDNTAKIRMPASFSYSGKDIDALRASTPTTANDYIQRGIVYANKQFNAEALADYTKAIELDPNNVYAYADRSQARLATGDVAGARADLAKADSIDPGASVVSTTRGMLAEHDSRPRDAIAAYSKVLENDPTDAFALTRRAFARAAINDANGVIADATAALKINPTDPALLFLRATAYLNKRDEPHALADRQALLAIQPQTAATAVSVARIDIQLGHKTDALKAYDQAIALEPKAYLYAERSAARGPDDVAGRHADLAAALKLEPNSPAVLWAVAESQKREGDQKAQIATLTRLIGIGPPHESLFFERAQAYRVLGDTAHALTDSAAALKLRPSWYDIYLMRANVLRGLGRQEDALKEAAAAETEAVQPGAGDAAFGYVVAANIYSAFDRNADAIRAYDRALAIKPDAYIYLNRGMRRPKSDTNGRLADYDAALSVDPTMAEALSAKADLQSESGDHDGAIATYTAALARKPADPGMLIGRGIAYARAGKAALATKDFADARIKAPSDGTQGFFFNNACWAKATANVALQEALDDCDTALRSLPGSSMVLDSRGFVLLRLGRFDEAIKVYGEALAKSPTMSSSLYGRAAAWSRKGDSARSQADLAAAVKADPDVRTRFEGYGIKL